MTATAHSPPELTIRAERCAHQRVAAAHCDDCVRSCPRHAWQLHDEGLAFDADSCDACGLCVAACPHEALEIPAPMPIISDTRPRELLIACEHAGIPQPDNGSHDSAGITACLHALTPGWIIQWTQRHQITQVRLASADCATCPRHPTESLQARWQPVAKRLAATGQPVPGLSPISARQWSVRATQTDQPDPRRRRFLGQLLQGPKHETRDRPQPSTLAPLTSGRRQLVRTLTPPGPRRHTVAPLWQVQLDPGKCTWCMACVTLCPELVFTQGIDTENIINHVQLHTGRCTGCGLCLDVCDVQALAIAGPEQTHPPRPQAFPLVRVICPVCRVNYHRHQPPSPSTLTTPTGSPCPTCRRGRPVRQDRLVQATASDRKDPA